MSRHEIPALDANHEVVVGWDHPLLTYFVQVYDKRKKGTDNELIRWWGTSLRELYEISDVHRVIRNHAELSPDMASTLYGDKDEGR